MKRFIISLTLISMGAIAFAPAASAMRGQSGAKPEDASLTEFIRRNRDARSKN